MQNLRKNILNKNKNYNNPWHSDRWCKSNCSFYNYTLRFFISILGDAIDIVEFDSGKDIVTEASLSKEETAVSLVGIAAVGVSAKFLRDYFT